jgi:hypothetical protein
MDEAVLRAQGDRARLNRRRRHPVIRQQVRDQVVVQTLVLQQTVGARHRAGGAVSDLLRTAARRHAVLFSLHHRRHLAGTTQKTAKKRTNSAAPTSAVTVEEVA